jgi:hypothetical protein
MWTSIHTTVSTLVKKDAQEKQKVVNYVPSKDVEEQGSNPCDIEG